MSAPATQSVDSQQERLFRKVTSVSIHSFVEWLDTFDDVDMKWTHDDKELDEFLEHANSIHPSIKFTHEVSKTKMSFLDTTTTVKEGNI